MAAAHQAVRGAGENRDHAACLMKVGLGVLVHEDQQRVVQKRARAFRNRLQLADQVRELFHVPAADVAQNALAFGPACARRFAVLMGVVVVPRGGVAEPGKRAKPWHLVSM